MLRLPSAFPPHLRIKSQFDDTETGEACYGQPILDALDVQPDEAEEDEDGESMWPSIG